MTLTDEQKAKLKQWASEGISLSDIQKRLAAEFSINLTYMDLRFAVLDLGIDLANKKSAVPAPDLKKAPADAAGVGPEEGTDDGAGAVTVEVDRVVKPGAVVSGSVRFSDGVRATWFLDQMGRLAIGGAAPGYKPPEQDLVDFQMQLREILARQGF